MENNEEEIKSHITKLVKYFASMFPDASKATSDLWRFVKTHDRRNYQLVRFSMDPNNDYRTVVKAIVSFREVFFNSGEMAADLLGRKSCASGYSAMLAPLQPVCWRP
jgi:sister-chromatid-cohesion protein PDS5